jgi:hypothetical protein
VTEFLLAIATLVGISILKTTVSAGALPLSEALSRGLLWLVTLGMDQQTRTDRFAELEAYFHDEISGLRQQGYPPAQIAVHLLCRRICPGLGNELAWRLARTSPRSRVHFAWAGLTFGCFLFALGGALSLAETELDLIIQASAKPLPMFVTVVGPPILVYLVGLAIMVRSLVRLRRGLQSVM